ncbi:MAG: hypothetical protein MJ172_00110 [Clostridia bacterium]|nr:hypothetical protein [Clostridia bacterium]
MAKRVTLASTFTAKYYPSQKLTDAFYLDGRLRSIREERTADISFDREDRGFFLSLFTSDESTELKAGAYPSYEPKLSKFCTDVKYSSKKIDDMTRSFRELAVDITGKMMLQENEIRNSYFSGLMVKDGEGFALTVGGGLAFLYRDDALYPLTDAGIPMEPIDAHGNNVGDFNNYYCSKSAHVLWSNFFRLNVDDCIILCNKELYSALGQRELLRILDDANDQCDAAGTIITQAAARRPNVPMQITISFVLDVKADEKKSFFKRHKKDEEDTEGLYVKSDFETGTLGQAAKASANAGFAAGYSATEEANTTSSEVKDEAPSKPEPVKTAPPVVDNTKILFGDDKVGGAEEPAEDSDLKFFGTEEAKEPVVEISAEEMMKRLFSDAKPTTEETPVVEEPVIPMTGATIDTSAGINPFDIAADDSDVKEMKIVSTSDFTPEEDDSETKAIDSLDKFLAENKNNDTPAISLDASGILAASLREQNVTSPVVEIVDNKEEEKKEEVKVEEAKEVNPFDAIFGKTTVNPFAVKTPDVESPKADIPVVETAAVIGGSAVEQGNNILFTPGSVVGAAAAASSVTPNAEFNPYSVSSGVKTVEEVPFVFGDDSVDILKNTSASPENKVQEVKKVEETKEEIKAEPVEKAAAEIVSESKEEKTSDDVIETTVVEEDIKENKDVEVKEDTHGFFEVASEAKEIIDAPEFTFGDDTVYEEEPEQNIDFPETKMEKQNNIVEANVLLPFESPVEAVVENTKPATVQDDIPPMPNFDGDTYNSPAYVPNTETPVGSVDNQNYAVGSYVPNEETPNYAQPYGSEPIDNADYSDSFFGNTNPGYVPQNEQFYDFANQNAGFGGETMDFDNEQPFNLDQPIDGMSQQYGDNQGQYYPGYDNGSEYPAGDSANFANMSDDNFFNDGMGEQSAPNMYDNVSSPMSGSMNDDEIARILGMGGFDADFDGMNDGPEQVARPVQHKTSNNPAQSNRQPSGRTNPQRTGTGRAPIKRKEPTYFGLTKAGWIFIAICAFILICIILIIGLGVSKCNAKKDKKNEATETTEQTYEIVADPTTVATQPVIIDPSAPIGRFVFSDYIGYRTWRDLLFNVYGITIEETNDPRIAAIVAYNGLETGYTPHSGDILLLPPMGVLDGSIPVTFSVNGSTPTETTVGEVTGEINLEDSTAPEA